MSDDDVSKTPPRPRPPRDPDARGAAAIDDESRLRLFGESIPRSFERDKELAAALDEVTPQAILRDLHRPVERFGVAPGDATVNELGLDRGARTVMAEVKAIVRANYRVPIETLNPNRRVVAEIAAEVREALGGSWADAPKQGYPATTSEEVRFAPPLEDESW